MQSKQEAEATAAAAAEAAASSRAGMEAQQAVVEEERCAVARLHTAATQSCRLFLPSSDVLGLAGFRLSAITSSCRIVL